MKIEVLYPEICCLFGDKANARYLNECMKEHEFIYTALSEEPAFVKEDVAMIYVASMSESSQEMVIDILMQYRDRLAELIEKGCTILATGNAFEIFGEKIVTERGEEVKALDLVPIWTKCQIPLRSNSLYLGSFEEDIKIVGYSSRFANSYYKEGAEVLFHGEKGFGMNLEDTNEGVRFHNFFGTHLLGPFLIENPKFTLYLQKLMGVEEPRLAYEETILAAYDIRLKEHQSDIEFE